MMTLLKRIDDVIKKKRIDDVVKNNNDNDNKK